MVSQCSESQTTSITSLLQNTSNSKSLLPMHRIFIGLGWRIPLQWHQKVSGQLGGIEFNQRPLFIVFGLMYYTRCTFGWIFLKKLGSIEKSGWIGSVWKSWSTVYHSHNLVFLYKGKQNLTIYFDKNIFVLKRLINQTYDLLNDV